MFHLESLFLTLYVDASFSTGGGRSRTGIAMYLVNPIDGSESLVPWASRRQTSMATSAPEAEVFAMAEGFAASIFLFDSLKELKFVKGVGPSCILSTKTDSAVALKQLNTQPVTVRSRTAAQKLTYLRELVYQIPQVEPVYISGQSQRADGQTKILSGQALRQGEQHFNLFSHAEVKIQVCYHPYMIGTTMYVVDGAESHHQRQISSFPTPPREGLVSRQDQEQRDTKGGESSQSGYQSRCDADLPRASCQQRKNGCCSCFLSPQERRQYEWYQQAYSKAHLSGIPQGERENIHDHDCIVSLPQSYAARASGEEGKEEEKSAEGSRRGEPR